MEMKPIAKTVRRFGPIFAWANRLLRVDLSAMKVNVQESAPHVPDFLGARGLAARICWDDRSEPVGAFTPENPLMIMPGALTGSPSPYSGRTSICAFSPQGWPVPWFTRSSIGGGFGAELRRAGYDGIVVTGAAETPVRICIRDDQVSVLPAAELWGLDTMETLDALEAAEGQGVRSLTIGPAGERLSRIATIHTASSSASGQGGFGAVMGSKRLKAISVIGLGRVSLADPERVLAIARALVRAMAERGQSGPLNFYGDIQEYDRELAAAGDGRAVCRACTDACVTPCAAYLLRVPGVVHDRTWSGHWVCVGTRFSGFPPQDRSPLREIYDWHLPRRAAFELNALSNRYGLNQFDLIQGMVPWLIACQQAGHLSEIDGLPMDWDSPAFWAGLLRAIAFREGVGDVLAEGGWAASRELGLGEDLVRRRYPGWGYASHCDGLEGDRVTFPYWLVSALQWMSDSRDPFNSGHGYLWAQDAAEQAHALASAAERDAALYRLMAVGERVYGSADSVDPTSGYRGKAYPAYHQTLRSVLKDCVPVDAHFPLLYDEASPDGIWRLGDVDGIGPVEGPAVEYHLFAAGTGVPWSEAEFLRGAERVFTLERALQVRHWARDRETDESVLPYFQQTELYENPYLEGRESLDREQCRLLADAFYALHGWDPVQAWPTQERMSALGLGELYEQMLAGGERARRGVPMPNC
jgi:aldehyde:ferredoxin oxidoreductase